MVKLEGNKIFLSVLEKEHCKKIWEEYEYDFESKTEPLNIGHSISKAESWFEEIQKDQGEKHVRLGIFIDEEGTVIGDVALQDLDWKNRSCSIGIGIAKKDYRGKGFGTEAVKIMLDYAFNNLGLERITGSTLEHNIAAQRSLEKNNFVLEGQERKAVYLGGKKWDKLNYSILREEFNKR